MWEISCPYLSFAQALSAVIFYNKRIGEKKKKWESKTKKDQSVKMSSAVSS